MKSNREPEQLPEGVVTWGWRYRVKISTRSGTRVLPTEYDTAEQAHAAYLEAMESQWTG